MSLLSPEPIHKLEWLILGVAFFVVFILVTGYLSSHGLRLFP